MSCIIHTINIILLIRTKFPAPILATPPYTRCCRLLLIASWPGFLWSDVLLSPWFQLHFYSGSILSFTRILFQLSENNQRWSGSTYFGREFSLRTIKPSSRGTGPSPPAPTTAVLRLTSKLPSPVHDLFVFIAKIQ